MVQALLHVLLPLRIPLPRFPRRLPRFPQPPSRGKRRVGRHTLWSGLRETKIQESLILELLLVLEGGLKQWIILTMP